MSDTCQPRITASCEEKKLIEATEAGGCPSWDTCLPFGGHLYSDGGCVHYEPGNPPADGTYGTITITNGCISGLGPVRPPLYTEANCADVPASCSGSGGGSGTGTISSQSGNMLTTDVSGNLLVQLHTESSSSIVLEGDGTADSPLTARLGAGASSTKVTATSPILVSKDEDTVYRVSHKKGLGTVVKGLEFDEWGHLVNYADPGESVNTGVDGIIGDQVAGIVAAPNVPSPGIYTIALSEIRSQSETQLGGYRFVADKYGRVTDIVQNISVPAGKYTLGEYNVTINALGSVTAIESAASTATVTHGFARKVSKNQSTVSYTLQPAGNTGFLITLEGTGIAAGIEVIIDGVSHDMQYIGANKCFYVTEGTYAGKANHTIELNTGSVDTFITPTSALFTCMFVSV